MNHMIDGDTGKEFPSPKHREEDDNSPDADSFFEERMLMLTEQLLQEVNACDTHGFTVSLIDGSLGIELPHAIVHVEKRNFYCDRGRYGFWVGVKPEYRDYVNIDFADAFPRYFFSLQRALDEMNDWVQFNKKRLGL